MAALLPHNGYNYPRPETGENELSLPINQVQEQVRTVEVPTPYEVEKIVWHDIPVPQVRYIKTR